MSLLKLVKEAWSRIDKNYGYGRLHHHERGFARIDGKRYLIARPTKDRFNYYLFDLDGNKLKAFGERHTDIRRMINIDNETYMVAQEEYESRCSLYERDGSRSKFYGGEHFDVFGCVKINGKEFLEVCSINPDTQLANSYLVLKDGKRFETKERATIYTVLDLIGLGEYFWETHGRIKSFLNKKTNPDEKKDTINALYNTIEALLDQNILNSEKQKTDVGAALRAINRQLECHPERYLNLNKDTK